MITYGALNSFGVFFKPLMDEFGWTRAATAAAFSLSVFFHGLCYVIMGKLNDRYGPRVLLMSCGFFLGLGFLLMSQIQAIWQLYLFYGLFIAIGISGYVPLLSTIAKWFDKTRGIMTGAVLAGAGVGTMSMPPVAERLITTYGWRISYGIIGTIAMVLMVSAAQFLRLSPTKIIRQPLSSDEGDYNSRVPGHSNSLQEAIRINNFWLLLGALFCQRFIIQATMVHLVIHVIDQGVSTIIAASMLTVIGGVSIGGRIIMGGLGDRIGNRPSFTLCFALMSTALFLLPMARDIWMLYLFAVAFGFTYGGMYTLGSPLAAELFGLGSHGLIFGAVSFGGTIGGAIGPALAGRVFDTAGSYNLAFSVSAAIGIVGLVSILLMRMRH
jgi:MFS family permease